MKDLNQLYTNNKKNVYHPDVMVNMTVKCMLNPKNKDFYIKSLTLEKVSAIISEDSDLASTFWTAYHIAYEERVKAEFAKFCEYCYHLEMLKECLDEGLITEEKYEHDVRILEEEYKKSKEE